MIVAETPKLMLREVVATDAAFVHALLTDPDFLRHIGHRGVDTLADAERTIETKYRASYVEHGFGMWVIEGKAEGVPLGLAGLVRREGLDHVDIGYAMLPAGRGKGYASEATRAVMGWAAAKGIAPVVAIVNPDNGASIAVLEKLGLVADRLVRLPGGAHDVMLYVPPAKD